MRPDDLQLHNHLQNYFYQHILLSHCHHRQGKALFQRLLKQEYFVLSLLIKSPYKTYFWNISYFMQVRKRFDAEKIRKKGWISGILSISFKENVNGRTIPPEEEKLKSVN